MASDGSYSPTDYGVDPSPEDLTALGDVGKAAVIRTSDRISFKNCRRRWGWGSALKGNLRPRQTADPLWLGTGFHFAMEDFHGYNFFDHPTKAFRAYCEATKRQSHKKPLPPMYTDLCELGNGMLNYYADLWIPERSPLRTLWVDGTPQVEVRAFIEVPFTPKTLYPDSPYSKVLYSVTIDRVIEDEEDGGLWLLDYKTAKQMQTQHLGIDPQIGAYYWAAGHIYPGRHIKGFIYQQHRKDVPDVPRLLANGTISTDVRQLTTHAAYRRVLVNLYGPDSQKWPQRNLDCLNTLAVEETADSDRFIRRDRVYRNAYSFQTEGTKILLELEDMLNPNLPLYPNPSRSCAYFCPFYHACVSLDDGSDFMYELELATEQKTEQLDEWRQLLPELLSQPKTHTIKVESNG